MNLKHARFLIRLARLAILSALDSKWQNVLREAEQTASTIEVLNQCKGVFVTLNEWPSMRLRGCIGFVYTHMPLWKTVQKAAAAAAFHDPRFIPITQKELDTIVIEITILDKPTIIKQEGVVIRNENQKKSMLKKIVVGKHGLIVESKFYSGLLLPQVAVEYNWNSEQFLQQTCYKAGLEKDCWKRQEVSVYRFSAEVFSEIKPRGDVKRHV